MLVHLLLGAIDGACRRLLTQLDQPARARCCCCWRSRMLSQRRVLSLIHLFTLQGADAGRWPPRWSATSPQQPHLYLVGRRSPSCSRCC
ncbi:MAG: hypothetical protein MZV65_27925 [Chromatiales bacterium]|nr:hypothetical protein [Chromatiales bacterium]